MRRGSEILFGEPLARPQKPGEEVLQAAKRVCEELDGGVFPIQGPPGSGKLRLLEAQEKVEDALA